MDAEVVAVMFALALALVPIGIAFRSRSLRVGLAVGWICIGVVVTSGVTLYRSAHAVIEPDNRPVERLREDYVGSKECGACHPHEYDTWKHTWHRTMTQVASPEAIFGDFDDVELEWQGWKTRLERRGDKFFAHTYEPLKDGANSGRRDWREIVLTTGSHHMQVYWYSRGPRQALGQLQFTYLKNDKKWVPRAAVFITPPRLLAGTETGRWNQFCIQCHTTRGRPGMANEFSTAVESDAVEFGIACGACHGPEGEHVRANRGNPLRRYAKYLSDGGDDTIVNAARLSKQRSAEVCGQCHGITTAPIRVAGAYERGYDYRAGDVLSETGRVIRRGGPEYAGTPTGAAPQMHDNFFWRDGMVRVSGREVNSLYDSPCFERGEMTCLSCHEMHLSGDDPRSYEEWADDMLRPQMRGNQACLQCHENFSEKIQEHTHHAAGSSGSECMNCHMPYTTWGLLKAIRQHEIDVPTVKASVDSGRPNACNACHIDQSLSWAADQLAAWYGQEVPELTQKQQNVAASLLWLLEGEAGQRALAAWLLGWQPAQAVAGTDWIAPLLAPLLDDPYSVVRYNAGRSLRSLPGFESFEYDYVGSEAARAPAKGKVWDLHTKQLAARSGANSDAAKAARLLLYADGSLDRLALAKLLENRNDRRMYLAE